MSFFKKLNKYYMNLKDENYFYQREIIGILFKLDKNLINDEVSDIEKKNGLIVINIIPQNKKSCPFYFVFGTGKEKNKFWFGYGKSGAILEDEYENKEELEFTKDAIYQHLITEVFEELIYIKDELIKSSYKYYYKIEGKKKLTEFTTRNRIIGKLGRKNIIKNHYLPFIEEKNMLKFT